MRRAELVPFPEPTQTDPCGIRNATWNVPADTERVHWTLTDDGRLIGVTQPGYVWPNGETVNSWGHATDSGAQCPPDPEIVQPIVPTPLDPCGPGNASWNLGPSPSNGFSYDLTEGASCRSSRLRATCSPVA